MTHITNTFDNGKIKLKNRLVMPPMATAKAADDGKVSSEILDYYDEKSKGGYISLVIIEHSYISEEGKASLKQLSVADDSCKEGLKELADIIHKNGSKAVMQLNHAGSLSRSEVTLNTVGPSSVLNPRKLNDTVPRELSKKEIKEIVERFKNAAIRVKKAGFDGVEIHSAHGYLLNQFLSPLTNKRTDDYGNDIYGRIKLHLEVIKAVREAVGDFPVLIRIGASDYTEGGTSMEDLKVAAKSFEEAGIDMIDITGGMCGFILPDNKEQGYFSELSEAVKSVVNVPVILTGGITEAAAAEKLLIEGKADFIGVGRAILADSDWARNAIENI
ncbi:NADH:flavin oxidoreductase [Sedimentibacter sp. B4]|uniref:NADH:flavin oxidoreductase n=1 Tax=Sedimentibacter sp. B4 TaxID=304766 RepID=UPI0003089B2D|nr:NADH:flavin oxidoreductase [Sedimentibacter sp. B4]